MRVNRHGRDRDATRCTRQEPVLPECIISAGGR